MISFFSIPSHFSGRRDSPSAQNRDRCWNGNEGSVREKSADQPLSLPRDPPHDQHMIFPLDQPVGLPRDRTGGNTFPVLVPLCGIAYFHFIIRNTRYVFCEDGRQNNKPAPK